MKIKYRACEDRDGVDDPSVLELEELVDEEGADVARASDSKRFIARHTWGRNTDGLELNGSEEDGEL